MNSRNLYSISFKLLCDLMWSHAIYCHLEYPANDYSCVFIYNPVISFLIPFAVKIRLYVVLCGIFSKNACFKSKR